MNTTTLDAHALTFEKHRYTGIRDSGRAQTWDDAGWPQVFREIYREIMSAGSNYDRFNMLLLDGKVIMTTGLHDAAYNYCSEMDSALSAIRLEYALKHCPIPSS